MVELRDEHGRHAVQRGAALLGDRLERGQRIEAFAGEDHAGAVGDRGEIAQHHAEAVIERHRDAQPVLRREPHRLADEEAVVEDVVMGERRAFGKAGGARGELDVDRLVELQERRKLGDAFCFGGAAARENVGKAQAAGVASVAEDDDGAQRRQPRRFKLARRRAGQFGRELAQHADIVRGLEALGQDQRFAADLVERVFKLGDAIGRIDVDQDEPGLGGGELGEHPLAVVRRPDADAIARLQPERQQPGGELVDGLLQLAVAHAHLLVAHDQRRPVRPSAARGIEELPDGFAEKRLFARAEDVTLRQRRHGCFLPLNFFGIIPVMPALVAGIHVLPA